MKNFFLSILIFCLTLNSFATNPPDEGMWLPMFIKDYNYQTMRNLGLHLTPEQLYDINNSSLKDAIVQLGNGFCTGEIVSADGLMFTNHHCGYQFIVEHSTMDHDYLNNGFWAMSKKEELPNPGFVVNFLVRMEDVSSIILKDVTDNMKKKERTDIIKKEIEKLQKNNSESGKYKVVIKPFYEGNEYYMFIYITYKDVRLVGAPPASIGKFGGDTDNWMWPRHTGDFSIFRIYTAPDGSPAEYSENNIPLHSKRFLPISLKGINKNDFTMIWGYPGSTERFMTSFEVNNTINMENPGIIGACNILLPVIRDNMNASKPVELGYADHYASLSNTWKNKTGETESLIKLKVADHKRAEEQQLINWINSDNTRKEKYENIIAKIDTVCSQADANTVKNYYYANLNLMISKTLIAPLRITSLSNAIKSAEIKKEKKLVFSDEQKESIIAAYEKHFEGCDYKTEKELLAASIKLWRTSSIRLNILDLVDSKFGGNENKFAEYVAEKSLLASKDNLVKFLNKPDFKTYNEDPVIKFYNNLFSLIMNNQGSIVSYHDKLEDARHIYLAALKEMRKDSPMYPDANSTMRTTYGTVRDYYPADGIHYNYFTTSKGILEKEIPGDPEFDVPARLKELILNKDFGQYANSDGELTVCFLSDNDITGGNSGSPIMNGNGELIGLAFDGNWEALSSDIVFNTKLQRCINVDIRYVLFIIDKFAGAKNLIDELQIIK